MFSFDTKREPEKCQPAPPIQSPSVAARQLPPGSGHAGSAALSQKAALHLPFPFTTPSVKIAFGALRRACRGNAPPSANADRSAA